MLNKIINNIDLNILSKEVEDNTNNGSGAVFVITTLTVLVLIFGIYALIVFIRKNKRK